jgi:membrane-associated phospholipid phosphatase
MHFRLKVVLIGSLAVVLSFCYGAVQKWPIKGAVVRPQVWLDTAIPFTPAAAWVYLSCFVYLVLSGCLLTRREDCWRFFWYVAAIGFFGDAIFFFYPTAVPPRPGVAAQPYAMIVASDGLGNAFPSVHVAFAVFSALVMQRTLRGFARSGFTRSGIARCVSWLWAVAIILSTLTIRQHVAIDVAGGAILGLVPGLFWWAACGVADAPVSCPAAEVSRTPSAGLRRFIPGNTSAR